MHALCHFCAVTYCNILIISFHYLTPPIIIIKALHIIRMVLSFFNVICLCIGFNTSSSACSSWFWLIPSSFNDAIESDLLSPLSVGHAILLLVRLLVCCWLPFQTYPTSFSHLTTLSLPIAFYFTFIHFVVEKLNSLRWFICTIQWCTNLSKTKLMLLLLLQLPGYYLLKLLLLQLLL